MVPELCAATEKVGVCTASICIVAIGVATNTVVSSDDVAHDVSVAAHTQDTVRASLA